MVVAANRECRIRELSFAFRKDIPTTVPGSSLAGHLYREYEQEYIISDLFRRGVKAVALIRPK